jgi:acyl-[acyl-carrier-protein] desaturase
MNGSFASGRADAAFRAELAPEAARLVDRHLAASREWFPHELIPYSRGRDMCAGEVWSEADTNLGGVELPDAVRSALFVNLLTEDNLPYYSRDVGFAFGDDDPYGYWVRRWTAEEGRHSMAIYGYLMVTRAIDPIALERGRMAQVTTGEVPKPPDAHHALVYLSLQELATRIAHRNTGRLLGDPVGYEVMARVAADENLHFLFYRDLASKGFELDPSAMVHALADEVVRFQMPGTGIPEFARHSRAVARAGIYDLTLHHDLILQPVVVRQWRLLELEGLTPEAERDRDAVVEHIERVARVAERLRDRRAGAD